MSIDARYRPKMFKNLILKHSWGTRTIVWAAGALLLAPAAHAVKLVNKDSQSHDLTIKCSSTAHSSIGASSTRDLGKGPCTVTVKKTGSAATSSSTLTIKGGKVSSS